MQKGECRSVLKSWGAVICTNPAPSKCFWEKEETVHPVSHWKCRYQATGFILNVGKLNIKARSIVYDLCSLLLSLYSSASGNWGSKAQVERETLKADQRSQHISTHTHTHTQSLFLSLTHIYCHLTLREKPFPFSRFLQGTVQKPKGKKKQNQRSVTEVAAYSKQQKGRCEMGIPSACVCCPVLAVERFEGYFPQAWICLG